MPYVGQTITEVFPTSISVDSATISGNTTIGGTLGVTGVSTLSDNIVFGASGKGVHLGVTSATASNLLDDYEEGTFTPAPTVGSVSAASGEYTKIGRLVSVRIKLSGGFNTTSNDPQEIQGLPFTSSTADDAIGSSMMNQNDNANVFGTAYMSSNTQIQLYSAAVTGSFDIFRCADLNSSNAVIYISAVYEASS